MIRIREKREQSQRQLLLFTLTVNFKLKLTNLSNVWTTLFAEASHLFIVHILFYARKASKIHARQWKSSFISFLFEATFFLFKIFFWFSILQNNTEVKVIFASHSGTDANNGGLIKHDKTKILSGRYNLIALAMLPMQLPSTAAIQPSVTAMPTTASAAPTTATTPVAYASVMSTDGSFKLEWTYSNSKLMFKMTCKMTGWCAVGFTTTADGRGMKNYDIAVGGFASNAGYITVSMETKFRFCRNLDVSKVSK